METFRQLGIPIDMMYFTVKVGAQIILVSLGVCGNLFTVYSVLSKSKLHRVTNIFIIVISMALIAQSLNASIDLRNHWQNKPYYALDPEWCKMWQTMNIYMPSMMAFLCFFAILDRYLILEHPAIHGKIMNSFSAVGMVLLSIAYPAVVAIPPIYLNWHTKDPNMPYGECKFKITLQYAFLSPLATFWFPMILDIIVMVKLFKAMERHDKALAVMMMNRGTMLTKAQEAAIESAAKALPWGEDQIRRQHRLAITLWSIYWNISIFWIPNHVWLVIHRITMANWPRATNFMPWFGCMPSAILPGVLWYYNIYQV
ncbi:octopamine receptor beta-2R-like [Macrosteles quadrilineatus]|uniref:octopamine receptor beta-2R-like n=1 Tax=Macrosteles quadrilineatus TaxID=74068 RepID=UPI0023E33CFB|nr:octopamine receptor beta-2R-like [Macrosteles quadrilineatus]